MLHTIMRIESTQESYTHSLSGTMLSAACPAGHVRQRQQQGFSEAACIRLYEGAQNVPGYEGAPGGQPQFFHVVPPVKESYSDDSSNEEKDEASSAEEAESAASSSSTNTES